MAFTLKIETDNAAFTDEQDGGPAPASEVARIISEALPRIADGYLSGLLYDVNGNRVGSWEQA